MRNRASSNNSMSTNVVHAEVVVRSGSAIYVRDILDYKSLTCVNTSIARIIDTDGTMQTVAAPYLLVKGTGYVYISCISGTKYEKSPMPLGTFQKCAYSFKECRDAINSTQQNGHALCKPQDITLCTACHTAGVETMIVLAVTCLFQLPLVRYTLIRQFAGQDSRWYKFWSFPFAMSVVFGTAIAFVFWEQDCYQAVVDQVVVKYNAQDIATYGGKTAITADIRWPAYIPIIAGSLALAVLVIGFFIPVPEIFQNKLNDLKPGEFYVQENSMLSLEERESRRRKKIATSEDEVDKSLLNTQRNDELWGREEALRRQECEEAVVAWRGMGNKVDDVMVDYSDDLIQQL